MNPGLVVKLRPTGPWRIGPDSGARNRVDLIYHSDSLYSAVTSAMMRIGALEEWLDATARKGGSDVCFSSCFPFVDEIGFVVPPRTIWPPVPKAATSGRVRWKSARFVPLTVVQSILSGEAPAEDQWTVDGLSECLMPAGRGGPFRTGLRWSAAVDRLTGASERHSTACIEFRPGAGLWTIVSFADDAARDRWQERVKTAFRWLADSGFGGERSRGWGRSEMPEFIEGLLPDMIIGGQTAPAGSRVEEVQPAPVSEVELTSLAETSPLLEPEAAAELTSEPPAEASEIQPEPAPVAEEQQVTAPEPEVTSPEPSAVPASGSSQARWMLSLFTPAPSDTVDWARGNYTIMTRGGRVESPAGSGDPKKQVHMIAEGSVLYSAGEPRGSAPDVAPEGFAHPVFRAGFAVSIPLPEVG